MTRQKNMRGDRKGDSNDSPEIPDRNGTSDIPGLPWWRDTVDRCHDHRQAEAGESAVSSV